jgi:plasmid stability protein
MATKELIALRMSRDLKAAIELKSKQHHRSMANQIEEYIRIGMISEENPDLPYGFIKNVLEAREEEKAGLLISYKLDT